MSGGLIYGALYKATPSRFDDVKREEMETRFTGFVSLLEQVSLKESGPIIDSFIEANDCHIVLYKGRWFSWDSLPAVVPTSDHIVMTRYDVQRLINRKNENETNLYVSKQMNFKQTADNEYVVVCLWTQVGVNDLWEALKKTLPLLIGSIIIFSLICSFIYTYLFARPVQNLSQLSGKIANMDFTAKSRSKRRDEIGDLGRDLDELSESLNETITSLNNRTCELELEIERVNELEKQKDVFFAAASHELKTPITIAQGQVRGMMDGIEPYNDLDTYLPKTLSSLKRMESLINEILTASRMQAGNEIVFQKVEMGSLLRNRLVEIEELLDIRGIVLETKIEDSLFFEGNPELTSMALGSFLSNAVFYCSESSKVIVTAEKKDGNIITSIRNTESHICEEDIPHLFEAFYRTDSSRSRRNGGSGLGLYLGKLIIERQNGTVSLENDGDDVVARIIVPSSTLNP